MKKILALLLALTLLSGAILVGGSAWVSGEEEDITYRQELLYGSGASAEGLSVRTYTSLNGYLHWDTLLHLGETPAWDVDFSFTPQSRWYREPGQSSLDISIRSNIGMTFGGTISFRSEEETSFLSEALDAVSSRTPNGEEHTETLPLADYVDYYSMRGIGWIYQDGDRAYQVEWPDAGDFFRIPVADETVEISIRKDSQGNVYELSYQIDNAPWVYGASAYRDGGWYFLYSAVDGNDGSSIPSGAAPGLYYLPMVERANEYGGMEKVIDTANIRLLYPLEQGQDLRLVDGDSKLLLLADGEGCTQAILLDVETMAELQRFEIPMIFSGDQGWQTRNVVDGSVIALDKRSGENDVMEEMWVTLWALGEDGLYHQEICCNVTPAAPEYLYWDSYFFDGDRLLMASYRDRWTDPSVDVVVCDGQGLQYAARFHSSQRDNRYGVRCDNDSPLLS